MCLRVQTLENWNYWSFAVSVLYIIIFQTVVIFVSSNGVSSECLPVLSDVPQGSVLGPLLLVIFINNLPDVITYSSTYLFTDNTMLVTSIQSEIDSFLLQHDINSLEEWCINWNFFLNTQKCAAMCFSLLSLSLSSQFQISDTAIDFF